MLPTKMFDKKIVRNVKHATIINLEMMIFFRLIGYINIKEIELLLYSSIMSLEISTAAKIIKMLLIILPNAPKAMS